MQFQFDISPQQAVPATPPQPPEHPVDLLRQLLEVQREHLSQILQVQREHLAHARAVAGDNGARWRQLLARWQPALPDLYAHCKSAYPIIEKAYASLLGEMVRELAEQGDDALDNDFAIQEFLDRYALRVGQLGHLLHLVGSLADAANQNEAAAAAAAENGEGKNPGSQT